ncbi:hypothetical protein JCM10207_004989 [Rhodosporidiobolus poonsookiae]
MSGDKKQAVVDALEGLSDAFGNLSKAHRAAQVAINNYAVEIDNSADPLALLGQFPALFAGVEGAAGPAKKGKAAAVVDDADGDDSKKRKRGPNKEKKVKDPNAPKRPPSAYIEYQNSVREEFRKQYPDLAYSEVLKKIGLVWQGMSDDDKKPWNAITEGKKAEYATNKQAYEAEHGGAPAPVTPSGEAKEYTGKKRGRKTNAERDAIAKAAAEAAAGHSGDIQVDEPKKEKKSKANPVTPKKAAAQSSDDDEDDDTDDDDDDESDDEESDDEPEPTPPKKEKKDKHKSKKSKH